MSWHRPDNIRLIVDSLHALEFIDEILVWNNNPRIQLSFSLPRGPSDRIAEEPRLAARYLCAAQAHHELQLGIGSQIAFSWSG